MTAPFGPVSRLPSRMMDPWQTAYQIAIATRSYYPAALCFVVSHATTPLGVEMRDIRMRDVRSRNSAANEAVHRKLIGELTARPLFAFSILAARRTAALSGRKFRRSSSLTETRRLSSFRAGSV